eukprot:1196050-Prorocentrum_minimum.AAC.1
MVKVEPGSRLLGLERGTYSMGPWRNRWSSSSEAAATSAMSGSGATAMADSRTNTLSRSPFSPLDMSEIRYKPSSPSAVSV